MPVNVVIGAQWGDEGKGRAVDWLASTSDVVARFAGGDNAGHTVNVGNIVYKLHLIPSGVLRDGTVCVLGNGMVVNPIKLLEEIDMLRDMGVEITPDRLKLSSRAHIITPAHILLDTAKEIARGDNALGTTLRGIGPTYLDKVGRKGIRAEQMLDIEEFVQVLQDVVVTTNERVAAQGVEPVHVNSVTQAYVDAAHRLQPYITDTMLFVNEHLEQGSQVLVEGAQGALLDVDHGSYPYVTSSNTTTGGALAGLGIGPTYVKRVVGVAKSFCTRVGAGPMPTELNDAVADKLRGTGENFWDEFGTTTGRKRRCGWLDFVMLKYSIRVNGLTELTLTKMDILSGFDELKIAIAYELDGERITSPPSSTSALAHVTPIYETLNGWQEDVTGIRQFEDLPTNAQQYVRRIAELSGIPVTMISVGPEREQLIHVQS
mgnify:CR=1 FL=1